MSPRFGETRGVTMLQIEELSVFLDDARQKAFSSLNEIINYSLQLRVDFLCDSIWRIGLKIKVYKTFIRVIA